MKKCRIPSNSDLESVTSLLPRRSVSSDQLFMKYVTTLLNFFQAIYKFPKRWMVHLEFGLDAPVGGFGVVVSAIQMLYDSIVNSPHLMWKDRWTMAPSIWSVTNVSTAWQVRHRQTAGGSLCHRCVELDLRRIVPTSSWRRRVGRAELAAPSCPRPIYTLLFISNRNQKGNLPYFVAHKLQK